MENLLIPKPAAIPVCSSSAGSHSSLIFSLGASVLAQMVKNLPAMQDTRVQSLGREDPLEKGMPILAWRIPWTEEPGRLQTSGASESWR